MMDETRPSPFSHSSASVYYTERKPNIYNLFIEEQLKLTQFMAIFVKVIGNMTNLQE